MWSEAGGIRVLKNVTCSVVMRGVECLSWKKTVMCSETFGLLVIKNMTCNVVNRGVEYSS